VDDNPDRQDDLVVVRERGFVQIVVQLNRMVAWSNEFHRCPKFDRMSDFAMNIVLSILKHMLHDINIVSMLLYFPSIPFAWSVPIALFVPSVPSTPYAPSTPHAPSTRPWPPTPSAPLSPLQPAAPSGPSAPSPLLHVRPVVHSSYVFFASSMPSTLSTPHG
jgi:hypothetical protein